MNELQRCLRDGWVVRRMRGLYGGNNGSMEEER